MLILTRKPGESLYIGDSVKITIVEIKGNQIRVGIDAPRELRIYREEIYLQILEENRSALEGTKSVEGLPAWAGKAGDETYKAGVEGVVRLTPSISSLQGGNLRTRKAATPNSSSQGMGSRGVGPPAVEVVTRKKKRDHDLDSEVEGRTKDRLGSSPRTSGADNNEPESD